MPPSARQDFELHFPISIDSHLILELCFYNDGMVLMLLAVAVAVCWSLLLMVILCLAPLTSAIIRNDVAMIFNSRCHPGSCFGW